MGYTYEQLKQMGATPGPTVSTPTKTDTSAPTTPKKKYTYAELVQMGAKPSTPVTPVTPVNTAPEPVEKKPWAGEMVKSLVSAPATMIARPFQAVQSAVQLAGMDVKGDSAKSKALTDEANRLAMSLKTMKAKGQDTTAVKAKIKDLLDQNSVIANRLSEQGNWKPSSGGIIADAPENWKDVKKDVGRGIETVALGMGSPIAGGAAFGLGGSLEQGNDLFSLQTLLQTTVGAGAGAILAKVGAPIFDKAGKVVGAVTPKFLKDLALKGAGSVEKWMAQQELLGGIAKGVSEKITSGASAFDKGVTDIATRATTKTKNLFKSQYPEAGKGITSYFENLEVDKLMAPSSQKGGSGYAKKSAEVNADATRRGIDIKTELKKNKIYASEHIDDDGKFRFGETADALENEAINGGADFLRPALREASPGVPRVSIQEARQEMINKIMKEPASSISPEQKKVMIKRILNEYGDNSVTASMYQNGYNLEDLYNTKLQTTGQIYKKNKIGVQTIADTLTMKQKQIESQVFADLLKGRAPKSLGIEKYFKENEAKFVTANYLRTLEGKKAPKSLFQRGVMQASKLSGGIIGLNAVGPFGFLSGYQFGGLASNTFINMSNPVKAAFLKSIKIPPSEARNIMRMFVSDAKAERLLRMSEGRLLTGVSKKTAADLAKMQNATGAVEMGAPASKPLTQAERMSNDMTQNTRFLNSTKQLPAPEPRTIVPNTQGTPNQPGVDYGTPEVGGMRQRIFQGGGTVTPTERIDFTKPASFSKFKTPGKKFMITTTDNPMGNARPDHINAQEMAKFRKFLDDNNIHYTPQKGKYGGNPENSNIIEIDNPQQQAIIDRYLQSTNPQAENIIISGDRAVRYDPRTKEAYQVNIKGKDLNVDPEADDFFSEVAGKKYSFPLYGEGETPLSIDEFNKLYNR